MKFGFMMNILLIVCLATLISGERILLHLKSVVPGSDKLIVSDALGETKLYSLTLGATDATNIHVDGDRVDENVDVEFEVAMVALDLRESQPTIWLKSKRDCSPLDDCYNKNFDGTIDFHVKDVKYGQKTLDCTEPGERTDFYRLVRNGTSSGDTINVKEDGTIDVSQVKSTVQPYSCKLWMIETLPVENLDTCDASSANCFKKTDCSSITTETIAKPTIDLHLKLVVPGKDKIIFTDDSGDKKEYTLTSTDISETNIQVVGDRVDIEKLDVGYKVVTAVLSLSESQPTIWLKPKRDCSPLENCYNKNFDGTIDFHVTGVTYGQKTLDCTEPGERTDFYRLVRNGTSSGDTINVKEDGTIDVSQVKSTVQPYSCKLWMTEILPVEIIDTCDASSANCFKNRD